MTFWQRLGLGILVISAAAMTEMQDSAFGTAIFFVAIIIGFALLSYEGD